MYVLAALVGAVGAIAALLAKLEPSREHARVEEARQTLRRAGLDYRRNSPEEVRALRILLEGGSISEC